MLNPHLICLDCFRILSLINDVGEYVTATIKRISEKIMFLIFPLPLNTLYHDLGELDRSVGSNEFCDKTRFKYEIFTAQAHFSLGHDWLSEEIRYIAICKSRYIGI